MTRGQVQDTITFFFFSENAGRKKSEERKYAKQSHRAQQAEMSKLKLYIYIKNEGVQQMEHKCAKKEKVQKQPVG